MFPKIGLITITFNSENVIEGFINSINSQDYDNYCLYIIDNNSKDGTLKKVDQLANKNKTMPASLRRFMLSSTVPGCCRPARFPEEITGTGCINDWLAPYAESEVHRLAHRWAVLHDG